MAKVKTIAERIADIRGQSKATAKPQPEVAAAVVAPPVIITRTKEDGLALIPPLRADVERLTITSAAEYHTADGILARIRAARSAWRGRMEKIIRPIRSGLDELYKLDRDVDKPLESLEKTVKQEMAAYKLEEGRRIQEEQDAIDRETERLRRQIAEQAAKEASARTTQMRERAQQKRVELEEQEADVILAAPEPVKAAQSSTRTVQKWRVVDPLKFFAAIGEGMLPAECGSVNVVEMNKQFKADPEGMKAWPGVEVFDDIIIAGR